MTPEGNGSALFPFLTVVLFIVARLIKESSKKKKEEKINIPPLPPKITPKKVVETQQLKPIEVVFQKPLQKKKKPRVANLLDREVGVRKLILLSEILANKRSFK